MNKEIKNKLEDPKRRASVDSKFAIHHVGHKRWDIISKNIGNDLDLWRNLFETGKKIYINDNTNETMKSHMYCGEEIYLSIRPDLISKNIIWNEIPSDSFCIKNIPKNKSSNDNKKNINKAEKIKQENIIRKIRLDVDALLKSVTPEPFISKSLVFKAKFVELILVKMMVQCRNYILKLENTEKQLSLKSASKYTSKDELNELHEMIETYHKELIELIVGFNKIVNEKRNDLLISKTCLADLIKWIDYAKKLVNFNATDVIIKMPELIFKTIYDGMLEHKHLGLYQSQKEIFEFVTTNEKFLALVHTMLGSGKTSMVLPICGWLAANRKTCKTKLIFCCPNEVVLLEVAHMVYGMGVSFAIVIHDQKKNTLEYKWSSYASKVNPKESAILYLCDIYVARMLLEERMKCLENKRAYMRANKRDPLNNPLTDQRIPNVPDYIFMGDELTMNADSQSGFMVDSGFSVTTEVFVDLMKIAPPKIILMSATLPTAEQLPKFYDSIIKENSGMTIRSFASSEAKIGCALISSTGELYAPHIGCQTTDEIKHILKVIKTNPFIGRFYTFEVLLLMVEIFKQYSLPIPNLAIMFDDPGEANQANIQQIAYIMLEQLISIGTNDTVKNVCQLKKNIGKSIDLNTIFTNDINRFNKGCLIFSSDPVATAYKVYQDNFNKYLDPDSERTIFQQVRLDSILAKYQREMELFQKALRRIEEKSDDGAIKQNKENDKKEKIRTESWQVTAKMVDQKPVWEFPSMLQICSLEHLKKVKCSTIVGVGGMIGPEDLPIGSSVSMDILTMLASGIGIYSTTSSVLDDEYLKTVLFLAKKGMIKIIFTDSSIAYGTNLAVSDIVMIDEPIISNGTVTESIVDKHSMKTIFQMLGRAGRGGNLSYEARIYTTSPDNKLINKIGAYSKGTIDEGCKDEIYNIGKAFEVLW
jgi:hypothetical protein